MPTYFRASAWLYLKQQEQGMTAYPVSSEINTTKPAEPSMERKCLKSPPQLYRCTHKEGKACTCVNGHHLLVEKIPGSTLDKPSLEAPPQLLPSPPSNLLPPISVAAPS
jgi:hypothetical protein